jgi:predicted CXXCH cytochrome family protein
MQNIMGKMKNVLTSVKLAIILMSYFFIFIHPQIVYSFHSGGVGYCEGCHNLHGSSGSSDFMLKGSDPSSTCLICHSEDRVFYGVFSKDGSRYTPGGDFYWLKKTFVSNVAGNFFQSIADDHGHNIIAADYGLTEDRVLTVAPGGTYPSSAMACSSCHNPHSTTGGRATISISGSYGETAPADTTSGNYRLLGGIGYNGGSMAGITFTSSAPVAVSNSENWTETDLNHTAYGSGMSEWCANCHTGLLNSGNKHPSGNDAKLNSVVISNYNSYIKTGDATGPLGSAYLALVPFELGTSDISLLDPASTSGPASGGKANVMCLTCHRAHAAAFQNIGRWDFKATFIADSHPQTGDQGVTGNDVLNSYYGRNIAAEFGEYQRQFCNKCHFQD